MEPNNNNQPNQPSFPPRQPRDIYSPAKVNSSGQPTAAVVNPNLAAGQGDIASTGSGDKSQSKQELKDRLSSIVSTLLLFLLAPLIAVLISMFIIQSYQVEGRSMESTLQDHDRLIVNKSPHTWSRITGRSYIPKRGDIIVFNQSGIDPNSAAPKQLIKRVIGLPGEKIVIKDGKITIYNKDHPKGFNPDESKLYTIKSSITPGNTDVSIKSNEIFVCGDNRSNSEDSRYFGPVDNKNIVGRLILRVLPLDKAQGF